jgi:hypothetical protein
MELTADPDDPLGVPRWVWDPRNNNTLQVRSVNLAGVGGVVAQLTL